MHEPRPIETSVAPPLAATASSPIRTMTSESATGATRCRASRAASANARRAGHEDERDARVVAALDAQRRVEQQGDVGGLRAGGEDRRDERAEHVGGRLRRAGLDALAGRGAERAEVRRADDVADLARGPTGPSRCRRRRRGPSTGAAAFSPEKIIRTMPSRSPMTGQRDGGDGLLGRAGGVDGVGQRQRARVRDADVDRQADHRRQRRRRRCRSRCWPARRGRRAGDPSRCSCAVPP